MRNRIPTKEREKFVRAVVEEVEKARGFVDCIPLEPQVTLLARRILRWGSTHGRLAEEACNGDWPLRRTDQAAWAKELKRQQRRAERLIREACGRLSKLTALTQTSTGRPCLMASFEPVFSNDPRGNTVKMVVPSGRSDSWGGIGLCV